LFREAPKHQDRNGFTSSEGAKGNGHAVIRNEHPATANIQKYALRVVKMYYAGDRDEIVGTHWYNGMRILTLL
jgi:hypothetical protein